MQQGKSKFDIQIKSISADGTFEGILASYNTVDLGGDSIVPGAFTKTLQERGNVVPLLWQHKTDMPIGDLALTDAPEGLLFKGRLLLELEDARKAYVLVKARVIKGMSIGYDTVKDSIDNGVRQLKELRLWEGSIVTFPMNEAAMVTSIKMVDGKPVESKGDFNQEYAENLLCSAGYQMFDALCSALYSVNWASGMDKQEKLEAAGETITQFQASYLPYLSQYLDWLAGEYGDMELMGRLQHEHKAFAKMLGRGVKTLKLEREVKEGRILSAASKKSLQTARDHGQKAMEHMKDADDIFDTLLTDEADDDDPDELDEDMDGDTSKAKAVSETKTEPVPSHSAAEASIADLMALIPKR